MPDPAGTPPNYWEVTDLALQIWGGWNSEEMLDHAPG
jgi:hypothetical protein